MLLNKNIYSWFIDRYILLLRYTRYRGAFKEEFIEKYVFCKSEANGIEHATNNFIKFKKVIEELIEKLNKLDFNIQK